MVTSIDRLLSRAYLDGMDSLPIADLRQRRHECQDVETGMSSFRRLIQGRLDIVHSELTRRTEGGEPSDLAHLIEQLPSILAEHAGGGSRGLLAEVVAPTGLEELQEMADQLDAIVDADQLASLPDLGDADLRRIGDRLTAPRHP